MDSLIAYSFHLSNSAQLLITAYLINLLLPVYKVLASSYQVQIIFVLILLASGERRF